MIPWLVAALIAVAIGGWAGADWNGGKQYDKGFAAGKAEAQEAHAKALAAQATELARQGLEAQLKASKVADEIQRFQQAAIEAARVQKANAAADTAADVHRLNERLRLAQATTSGRSRADRSAGVSSAACAPGGDGGASARGVLPEGIGRDLAELGELVRLAAKADAVNAQYQLCRNSYPKVKP